MSRVCSRTSPHLRPSLSRTKTRVRKDRDERRVAGVERFAHRLDRSGRKWLHLLPPRRPRLLHAPGRIRRDVPARECVLQDRAEQIHRMPNRNGTRPRCQAVRLPTPNDLRRDLTQSDRREVRTEVVVVEARVVKPRLCGERRGMRRGPRSGPYSPRVSVPASSVGRLPARRCRRTSASKSRASRRVLNVRARFLPCCLHRTRHTISPPTRVTFSTLIGSLRELRGVPLGSPRTGLSGERDRPPWERQGAEQGAGGPSHGAPRPRSPTR